MERWAVSGLTDVPTVSDGHPDDPDWYPLQHALGIDTFGVNLFVAAYADQCLVGEHDERESGQQELYVLLEGRAVFELDGEKLLVESGTAVAVIDPSVRRSAKAAVAGATLLVIGAADAPFASTWNPSHFSDIPRPA
jgi:quercetin dioxygenase-like cupin family protein